MSRDLGQGKVDRTEKFGLLQEKIWKFLGRRRLKEDSLFEIEKL
jgi:hypothetical protein